MSQQSQDVIILRSRRKRGEDGYKVFSVRIRDEIVADLDRLSSESGHSRNELIGTLLEFAIKHCVVEK